MRSVGACHSGAGSLRGAEGTSSPRGDISETVSALMTWPPPEEGDTDPDAAGLIGRRFRPPRRPRRRCLCSACMLAEGCEGAVSLAAGIGSVMLCSFSGDAETSCCGPRWTGKETSPSTDESSGGVDSATSVPAGAVVAEPRRASAASAFVRHCARRNRSAAVVYHRAASECAPAFSCHWASSKATMASRVRS